MKKRADYDIIAYLRKNVSRQKIRRVLDILVVVEVLEALRPSAQHWEIRAAIKAHISVQKP